MILNETFSDLINRKWFVNKDYVTENPIVLSGLKTPSSSQLSIIFFVFVTPESKYALIAVKRVCLAV